MSFDEFGLIRKIQKIIGRPSRDVLLGIGDDAAVLKARRQNLLLTVDTLVEGVHFDFKYCRPADVGHKALAVSLSDIAAMGGQSKFALVTLGIFKSTKESAVLSLMRSLHALARREGVEIVGGNCVRSPKPFFVDVTVVGETQGMGIRRSTARAGHLVAVTGFPGDSAAGLAALQRWGGKVRSRFPKATKRHLTPEARTEFGAELGRLRLVSSLIDISDGLTSELGHLSESSGCVFHIDEGLVPRSRESETIAKALKKDAALWSLTGGEAYELLLTFPAGNLMKIWQSAKKAATPLTVIGEVGGKGEGIEWRSPLTRRRVKNAGWNHFRGVDQRR
jgi:thiamine-monophosphate kinase